MLPDAAPEARSCSGTPIVTLPREAEELQRIARRYRAFADDEAAGVSALCDTLARAAAGSPEVLGFLATLPAERRQPNLGTTPRARPRAPSPRISRRS